MYGRMQYLDRIQGGMIGGAVGDALGYPVEFLSWKEIQKRYGNGGIRHYTLDYETGTAVLSDDTQMSLFTANGILIGETQYRQKGTQGKIAHCVYLAYQEWLKTQRQSINPAEAHRCWIFEVPELHNSRAPGTTCLSALRSGKMGTIDAPLNSSKGCGGVMRVAPLALHFRPETPEEQRLLDLDGAEIAAITHGSPLGYLPAAVVTHIISLGVYGGSGQSLREAVDEAWHTVKEIFCARVPERDISAMEALLTRAVTLAALPGNDEEHISAIGAGWTGDEALAIAIYCCLRYPDDFSRAVIAAVNHSGDSDSTGAVTGNILGSWLGCRAIDPEWTRLLELRDVLLEMAEDLCFGCRMYEGDHSIDEAWVRKYCQGHMRCSV